jgi:hypothetical protein
MLFCADASHDCVVLLQDAFKLAVWGSTEGPPTQKKAAAAGTKRKAAEVDVSMPHSTK